MLRRSETSLKYLPTKIAVCCVLHNLCELRNDAFEDEWMNEVEKTDMDDGGEREGTVCGDIQKCCGRLFL